MAEVTTQFIPFVVIPMQEGGKGPHEVVLDAVCKTYAHEPETLVCHETRDDAILARDHALATYEELAGFVPGQCISIAPSRMHAYVSFSRCIDYTWFDNCNTHCYQKYIENSAYKMVIEVEFLTMMDAGEDKNIALNISITDLEDTTWQTPIAALRTVISDDKRDEFIASLGKALTEGDLTAQLAMYVDKYDALGVDWQKNWLSF